MVALQTSPPSKANSSPQLPLFDAQTGRQNRGLGIFTKTHVKPTPQGFQRVHDFLLQDQSAKLLPKERVCNCLKKRIDKTKNREVKYNEIRETAH